MPAAVLVVDDHATFRRYASRLLEQAGLEVAGEAVDAASALKLAKQLRPDAVLLDIGLPDRQGLDLVSEFGSAVVILVSSEEDWRELAEESGAREFIAKDELTADRLRAVFSDFRQR